MDIGQGTACIFDLFFIKLAVDIPQVCSTAMKNLRLIPNVHIPQAIVKTAFPFGKELVWLVKSQKEMVNSTDDYKRVSQHTVRYSFATRLPVKATDLKYKMIYIYITIIFLLFLDNCFAQSIDSLVYKSENITLSKYIKTGKYKLVANETYDQLSFAKRINSYFQILDENNQIFYIGEDGDKKGEVEDYMGYCGTVPHFTFSIKNTGTHFEIYEDETFYDSKDQIPAHKTRIINTQNADSVLFINGKTQFNFTANFGLGITTTNTGMLILAKNGKFFLKDSPELKFDSIDFTNYHHSLKTKSNDLYGILGVVEPKYKRIEDFIYYLAEAETVNGETVYIDIEGNEYKSVANKVIIKGFYKEPPSLYFEKTKTLKGVSMGEFVEIKIHGTIKDFKHVKIEMGSAGDLLETEILNEFEQLIDQTLIIKTFMPEGIPMEKIKWKSLSGKEYEFFIAEDGIDGGLQVAFNLK